MNSHCLDLWRGSGMSDPTAHSAHFMLAAGALAAPAAASFFLKHDAIEILFPMLGITIGSMLPLSFITVARMKDAKTSNKRLEVAPTEKADNMAVRPVLAFGLMTFLAVGTEKTIGMLLTTSANGIDLLDTSQGAILTSIYWSGFALSRLAAIFTSTRLPADLTIHVDFLMVLVPAMTLLGLNDPSYLALKVSVATMGFGVGPIYSTLLLIYEKRFGRVTGWVSGIINAASVLGQKVFLVVVAQLVSQTPRVIFTASIAAMSACVATMFAVQIRTRIQD